MDELETYIEKTEDRQLGMLVEIVGEYGTEIPALLEILKQKHVDPSERDKAELIFSTVHRCKGMEYDSVQLVNDFVTERELIKLKEKKKETINTDQLNEEINLLYVAVTRTKNKIDIPEPLMPADFPYSSQIHVTKDWTRGNQTDVALGQSPANTIRTGTPEPSFQKAYSVAGARDKHADAYKPWTEELDDELTRMYLEGADIREIAQTMGRTKGAIKARLEKLEDLDGD
jgi:hypothetical protein